MSEMIAYQIVRTKEFIESYIESLEKTQKAFIDVIGENNYENFEIGSVDVEYDSKNKSYMHAEQMLGSQRKMLTEVLINHHWYVGVNNTDLPLIISDNPVATNLRGYAERDIEISFPISEKLVILIFGSEPQGKLRSKKTHFIDIDEEIVKTLNIWQVRSSNIQTIGNRVAVENAVDELKSKGTNLKRKSRSIICDGAGKGRVY